MKMIEIYTGFVGSGKSYHATYRGCEIADAPKGKRWVIANYPIKPKRTMISRMPIIGKRFPKYNTPRWIYKSNDELTVDYLVQQSQKMGWYGKESQCLLIIDEAGVVFNARDWMAKPEERKAWIKFFSQSRKFGYDVILIAQDVRMIDRQIRSLAEYEVQHKKLNNWSIFKIIPITIFAGVSFWNGIRTIRGSLSMTVYKKSVADRYDTLALFGYGENAQRTDVPAAEGGPA